MAFETKAMTNRLEYVKASERFYDFCLWEYAPAAAPAGKLRSASLLFQSFCSAGLDDRVFELVTAIRQSFGSCRTVWGVKRIGDELRWEFYFYDYRRAARERSITRFVDLAQPVVACQLPINEQLPYFMFSVDIDERLARGSRGLDEVHLYIGNTGSTVSSGICYSLTETMTRLENFYFFFDAKTQIKEIVSKLSCSAYFAPAQTPLEEILWPELRDCSLIVAANKQNNDAVYFSRINVDQLIFFLKRMGYPVAITGFIEAHRGELDHLLYDVGFDYHTQGNDLIVLKSGYYGYF